MNYKIRCSSLGKIMTNARAKNEVLSETAKTALKQMLIEHLFLRKKEVESKYLTKGIEAEQQSIDLYNEFTALGLEKNTKRYNNQYLTGEPDALVLNTVYEFKSSWDLFTFPIFETEQPNKDYYWQVMGYMALTDTDHAEIIYVLADTPEQVIQDELRRFCWKNNFLDLDPKTELELRNNLLFSDIPLKNRIKMFRVERDEMAIQEIYDKCIAANEYMTTCALSL